MPAPPDWWAARFQPGQSVLGSPSLLVAWQDRDPVWLPVLDVSGARMDSGQAARRRAVFRVPSSSIPAGVGAEGFCVGSLVLDEPAGAQHEVAQICGYLAEGPRDDEPGTVALAVESVEAVPLGHGFTRTRTLAGSALASLRMLVRESLPRVPMDYSMVADVPTSTMTVEPGSRARWDTIVTLATVLGAEVGATRTGALRVAPVERRDRPIWRVLVERLPRIVSSPRANVVVVQGDSASMDRAGTPAVGVAVDDRRYSPGYIGPEAVDRWRVAPEQDVIAQAGYPIRTRHVSLPVVSSVSARLAARADMVLGDQGGEVQITVPWNPWADWGDLLLAQTPDGDALSLVVTGLDPLPIVPAPYVTVTGRLE